MKNHLESERTEADYLKERDENLYAEPPFDASKSEWDAYFAKMDRIIDPIVPHQFKSVEQQKTEREQERRALIEEIESKLPVSIIRAIKKQAEQEFKKISGQYLDGGYTDDQTKTDHKALVSFIRSLKPKQLKELRLVQEKYLHLEVTAFKALQNKAESLNSLSP